MFKLKFLIVNFLTMIRLIVALIIIPIYFKYGGFVTSIIVAISYLTDCFDGFLARHFNCSTFFGSILDGTSDKIFNIANLIIFLSITPLAIIPIILELIIIIIQIYKYKNNYVVKTSLIGKVKMWVMGLTIVLTFLTIDEATTLFKNLLLIPLIIFEILTVLNYLKGIFKVENKRIKKIKSKGKFNMTLNEMLFSHSFYDKNKNDINIKMVCAYLNKNSK